MTGEECNTPDKTQMTAEGGGSEAVPSSPVTKTSPSPPLSGDEICTKDNTNNEGISTPLVLLTMTLLFTVTSYLYCHDESNLSGSWILDDKGTISMNPVVKGEVPWMEVWNRDFWGHDQLSDPDSHKSWRPICTASYRLNREWVGGTEESDTYWYHVVDRVLHGIVTALTLPVAGYTFHPCGAAGYGTWKGEGWHWFWGSAVLVAVLYGVHPVHVEAVANTTGRAEVLCALFYFLGFWVYARFGSGVRLGCFAVLDGNGFGIGAVTVMTSVLGVFWTMVFAWASMLCKEHGVTLPLMCVIWDAYIGTNTSLPELRFVLLGSKDCTTDPQHDKQRQRKNRCRLFLLRTLLCAIGTISLGIWRLSKNGDSKPDFVCEQNPAACDPNIITRFFTYSYLWCFNFWLMLFPDRLCPDWSGGSIPLLDHPATDPRFPALFLLWGVLGMFVYHSIQAALTHPPDSDLTTSKLDSRSFHYLRRTIITSFCWMLLPFLMSSNLLVYVGFVVADRTLYMPSFGFCLLLVQGLVLSTFCDFLTGTYPSNNHSDSNSKPPSRKSERRQLLTISIIILTLYTIKQQAQTKRWSSPLLLWGQAYRTNPQSCINGKEYGMSLVNEQRPRDAVQVLRMNHKRELNSKWFTLTIANVKARQKGIDPDPLQTKVAEMSRMAGVLQTRFKLVTAMGNSGDCMEALPLIEEGLKWADGILEDVAKEMKQRATGMDVDIDMNIGNSKRLKGKSLDTVQKAVADDKAYLYVARSRCSKHVADMGSYAYSAVMASPGNEYAMNHAYSANEILTKTKQSGLDPSKVFLKWVKSEDPKDQTAQLGFVMEK